MSLKLIPFEISDDTVSYSTFIVTAALSCIIFEINRDIVRKSQFLPRDAMHSADYAVVRCPCVCLSHASMPLKRLYVIKLFTTEKQDHSSFCSRGGNKCYGIIQTPR